MEGKEGRQRSWVRSVGIGRGREKRDTCCLIVTEGRGESGVGVGRRRKKWEEWRGTERGRRAGLGRWGLR